MGDVGLRELRQQASELVRRVETGEVVTVTISGRPVAELRPLSRDRTWRRARDLDDLFSGPDDAAWAADRELVDRDILDPHSR
ncbi:MAG: type II toxin-antitoxin system prevent-host-death family antitoxin [Lapillicoccus sp.]